MPTDLSPSIHALKNNTCPSHCRDVRLLTQGSKAFGSTQPGSHYKVGPPAIQHSIWMFMISTRLLQQKLAAQLDRSKQESWEGGSTCGVANLTAEWKLDACIPAMFGVGIGCWIYMFDIFMFGSLTQGCCTMNSRNLCQREPGIHLASLYALPVTSLSDQKRIKFLCELCDTERVSGCQSLVFWTHTHFTYAMCVQPRRCCLIRQIMSPRGGVS